MRFVVAAIVLALFAVPALAAPFELDLVERVEVEDVTGDAHINGVPADHLDITRVAVEAANGTLVAEMDLVDASRAKDAADTFAGQAWYWVTLRFQEERFDIVWDLQALSFPSGSTTPTVDTVLLREDGDGWKEVSRQRGTVDFDRSQIRVEIPLDRVVASSGFTPGPGEQIVVESAATWYDPLQDPYRPSQDGSPGAIMRGNVVGADDVQFPEGTWVDIPGDVTDDLGIGTAEPVRYSNGEATTYHWPVRIVNRAATADMVVSVETDDDITAHAPSTVHVPAAGSAVIDVYATTPFAHGHGGGRALEVVVEGGGHRAVLPLEVRYLEVPQPAGHHDTVHMHARNPGGGQGGYAWMDTLAEPLREVHQAMELMGSLQCGSQQDFLRGSHAIAFPLEPQLRIGVAARTDEPGKLTATFASQSVRPAGTLWIKLVTYDPFTERLYGMAADPDDPLAAVVPIDAATGTDTVPLELDLPVPPELGRLPPGSGLNLGFVFAFCPDGPTAFGFERLVEAATGTEMTLTDAKIQLPLEEYRDVIDLDLARGLELSVDDGRRSAAPGATVLWELLVAGEGDDLLDVRVFGVDAGLLTVHGGQHAIGDVVPVSLVVPDDRQDLLEAIVEVSVRDEPERRAAYRLVVDVDPAATRDDRALVEELAPKQQSPAGILALVGVALALAARRR